MLRLETDTIQGAVLYVDLAPDAGGQHRVTCRIGGERTGPAFAGLGDLLRWMIAVEREERGELGGDAAWELAQSLAPGWSELPAWEDPRWSVFERLLDCLIGEAWAAATPTHA